MLALIKNAPQSTRIALGIFTGGVLGLITADLITSKRNQRRMQDIDSFLNENRNNHDNKSLCSQCVFNNNAIRNRDLDKANNHGKEQR
ncbi:MAG: hypothetical protein K0R66_1347 [Gammaproteobacteria bacterium]|jgi:hypothetical protein|nr:hypothetical protein [Gammaproteobacteria bacterium]